MSGVPPLEESNYPRPDSRSTYGSADRLQALGEGYYGLNWVFLLNVVLSLSTRLAIVFGPLVYLGSLGLIVVVIGAATFPFNNKIGMGLGWASGYAILASILIGLNSALCCGVIGYVVMQQIAGKELAMYGLRTGFLGVKKKAWQATVEARRQAEAMRTSVGPPRTT